MSNFANEKLANSNTQTNPIATARISRRDIFDLLIIGGGINGTSIFRNAAGRKLKVGLFEMNDIGWATSSSSTKLLYGGLRYLEHRALKMIKETLKEREILFNTAPHLAWRKQFVFPCKSLQGRPKFLRGTGLFPSDNLIKLQKLQKTKKLNLKKHVTGYDLDLKEKSKKAYEYSDLVTLDSKFCVLNAVDARRNGAQTFTRHEVIKADRYNGVWTLLVQDVITKETRSFYSRALVNASGPWINSVIENVLPIKTFNKIRKVQGSHIIVPKLFDHEYGYFLKASNKNYIFVLPFEENYTMIGTAETEYEGDHTKIKASVSEKEYLINNVNHWFKTKIKISDIVWDFSGVRVLCDDGKKANSITQDYEIKINADADGQTPVVSLFGGNLSAAREIGEKVVNQLAPYLQIKENFWTRTTPLIGGEFGKQTFEEYRYNISVQYPGIPFVLINRLVRCYGTKCLEILKKAQTINDLGRDFGHHLYEAEVKYMVDHEFAQTGDDVVWRRTRLGIRLNSLQIHNIDSFTQEYYRSQQLKAQMEE